MKQNATIKAAILRCMREFDGPVGATRLMDRLESEGFHLQPRTIRFYLLQLDREGLTRFVNRRLGRELTPRARDELAGANIMDKVGFVAAKIDSLGYRMTFCCDEGAGTIIANIAMIDAGYVERALEYMRPAFARKLGMGNLLALKREGETIGGFNVPRGQVALGTVCSMTVNGIMLAERIAVTARFGGLLEMREGRPARFVELLAYSGTTLDPLEFFINARMTSVRQCALTGNGIIGASFREIPSIALEKVHALIAKMERLGLGGVLAVGRPNKPLLNIPVAEGRTGIVVTGGLNPIATLREVGAQVSIKSLMGLEDFKSFLPFHTIRNRFPN